MNINFSRHAKRRAKLYGISESIVVDIITGEDLTQGQHEIIKEIDGLRYPLKIVVHVENNSAKVITNYPLKKGFKK